MKFVYKHNNDKKNDHWQQCEKKHAPFIEISRINHDYMNIFYDVTNYDINLDEISESIKKMHSSYTEFFMITDISITEAYEQYYFFNIIVKCEHAEFLAEQLYDYLLSKLH
jgi:hypothetical protein